jgi:uncharacterized protein YdeI (YjbR/CyaY-like superfamily)
MNPQVDKYLIDGCMRCKYGGTPQCKVRNWPNELKKLRNIVLACGLTEELKWGVPCYTFQDKNVVMINAFKNFCAINFFTGVLLNNSSHLLEAPGRNSQSARYLKFNNVQDIIRHEAVLKAYIFEAIEIQKVGLKVAFKKNPEPLPEELQHKLTEDPVFKNAFESLSSGRQRGYILYFSQAKQSKSRLARIEKSVPKILHGEGLHDKYKSVKK